jgi:hypothetical protein
VRIKVPSESYVGMQFAPKNKSTTKALAYTGMLGLVHEVQQRTLRSHHEDAHYCAKNYKNLRHYDVMVKKKLVEAGCTVGVAFVSSDDKAKVCDTLKLRDRCKLPSANMLNCRVVLVRRSL